MGTSFPRLCLFILVAGALALAGCGSDGDTGMAGPAGPPGPAGEAAEAPSEAEIAAIVEEAVAAQPDPEVDTSALDDAIAALAETVEALTADTEALEAKTADPATPLEILGADKLTMSLADRGALAAKIAGELNALNYGKDKDGKAYTADTAVYVTLPELTETQDPVVPDVDAKTLSVSTRGEDLGFLSYTFPSGEDVDLTNPGDVNTLSVKPLLGQNGVKLMAVSISEASRWVQDPTTATGYIRYDADGSTEEFAPVAFTDSTTDSAAGNELGEDATTVGGPIDGLASRSTRFIGKRLVETITFDPGKEPTGDNVIVASITGPDVTGTDMTTLHRLDASTADNPGYDTDTPTAGASVAAQKTDAIAAYNALTSGVYSTQNHYLTGYGAWLEDTFFLAYNLVNGEHHTSGGGTLRSSIADTRKASTTPATDLSGRGETAHWKGLMVGHDMDENQGPTFGDMLKGNAMITANLAPATLADQSGTTANMVSLVDVSLTEIINSKGKAARVSELHWTNLDLMGAGRGLDGVDGDGDPVALPATFAKGGEISGTFYDDGDEVIGNFNKEDIVGVFGALEYDMPAMDDMMAEN